MKRVTLSAIGSHGGHTGCSLEMGRHTHVDGRPRATIWQSGDWRQEADNGSPDVDPSGGYMVLLCGIKLVCFSATQVGRWELEILKKI